MLGLFLSAAQEYSSVQFRTLEIEQDTDLRVALHGALDRGYTAVEIIHRDGSVFTSEGHVAPSVFGDASSMILNPGDVVVMSGGATGISAHLARSLVPFHAPPGLPGENSSGSEAAIRARDRRSPGPWRIYTPQGSRQRTIPAM